MNEQSKQGENDGCCHEWTQESPNRYCKHCGIWEHNHELIVEIDSLYAKLKREGRQLLTMIDDFTPDSDERFNDKVEQINRIRAAIVDAELKLLF